MLSLEEIESEIARLARRISASSNVFPTFGFCEQSGRPPYRGRRERLSLCRRGTCQEFERLTTHDLDELLYDVFQSVTSTLAFDYELKHRVQRQDGRRIAFQQQIELLSVLSPEGAERRRLEHTQILRDHPFDV